MPEEIVIPVGDGPAPPVSSPPPALHPEQREPDPAERLHELARELTRTRNRRLIAEYLRLRRAVI